MTDAEIWSAADGVARQVRELLRQWRDAGAQQAYDANAVTAAVVTVAARCLAKDGRDASASAHLSRVHAARDLLFREANDQRAKIEHASLFAFVPRNEK